MTYELGTSGSVSSELMEAGTNAGLYYRWVDQASFDTSTTHDFYMWCPEIGTAFCHQQVTLIVTYEFNASTSTSIMNSLEIPVEFEGPLGIDIAGGTSDNAFQKSTYDLSIQESNISTKRIAAYVHWQLEASITGLYFRVGTGTFQLHSSINGVYAGGDAAMVRNDSAYTLTRGTNRLEFYGHGQDASDSGSNVGVVWIINYTSDKHADGVGAHNHTVEWLIKRSPPSTYNRGTEMANEIGLTIPETDYFINNAGFSLKSMTRSNDQENGCN